MGMAICVQRVEAMTVGMLPIKSAKFVAHRSSQVGHLYAVQEALYLTQHMDVEGAHIVWHLHIPILTLFGDISPTSEIQLRLTVHILQI